MRRSLVTVLLALLVATALVGPAAAAAPPVSDPSPAAIPSPTPDPAATPEPTADPEPTAEPEPAPTAEPTPAAEPTPTDAPSEEPAPPSVDPAPSDPALPSDPVPSPSVSPEPTPAASDPAEPTAEYIVMVKPEADLAAVGTRHRQREGTKVERTFQRAFTGFTATLDKAQKAALLADPNVIAVVPDEPIELTAQTMPTGVSRVGGRTSPAADINGGGEGVDADIAIVDTGVAAVADLHVDGYTDCTSGKAVAHPGAGRDIHGHGTHVAGTAAAIDNGSGVVGMAPGARLWGVRILDDSGSGKLSWYVCGLDWILGQRDPANSALPKFEVVNMSVTKWGSDDGACGTKNDDPLHAAICRLVAARITVVVAAANDSGSAAKRVPASYNEVITVSALADTDGKAGSLGGNRCYSWGGYDSDDTFANFSNYGGDVDIMAPGKCIWSTLRTGGYGYMSGTSMASPTVAGAAALYKSTRPMATPAEVKEALQYLGNLNWKTSTDPDDNPDRLLDISRLGSLGSFIFRSGTPTGTTTDGGGTASVPIAIDRSSRHFERVRFSVGNLPSGWKAAWSSSSVLGFTAESTTLKVTVPAGTDLGSYPLEIRASAMGSTRTTTAMVVVGPGAMWQSITPTRIVDTRVGLGLSSRLSNRSVRTFQVTGSGIPDDVVAVTGNLTVTSPTSNGFVALGPSLTTSPSTSSINVVTGQTLANGVTVQLAAGRLSAVFVGSSGSTAQMLFDVTGYYRNGSSGNTWYGIAPRRLLDTRVGNGLSGSFVDRTVRSVQIAGRGGLPSSAIAITGNVTVTGASGSGYLSIGPSMTSSPSTSTLNFQAGRTLANNVTLRLGTGGTVSAVVVGSPGMQAQVLIDVTGYFRSGSGGARWYAVPPVRKLDTRSGTGLSGRFKDGVVRTFQVTGGSVPLDAKAIVGNLTVTGGTGSGYVSAGPTMTSSPSTSNINVRTSQTLANGLVLRVASGGRAASVFQGPSGSSIHEILDIVGFFR